MITTDVRADHAVTLELPPDPSSVGRARDVAAAFCATVGSEVSRPVELIVSELATNAIRHAGTPFEVRLESEPDGIRVTVVDAGAGFDPDRVRAQAHRGLQIVRRLAGDLAVTGSVGQVAVSATVPCP